MQPTRVGAAMMQGGIHALDQAAIDITPISAVEYTRNAAHRSPQINE
jgi:hypothetical protein